MALDLQERRVSLRLSGVIDDGLDLAEECDWRYALAYLISEKVPAPIIQRLLFGGGRERRSSNAHIGCAPEWNGDRAYDMSNLFDSLGERRLQRATASDDPFGAPRVDADVLETLWD